MRPFQRRQKKILGLAALFALAALVVYLVLFNSVFLVRSVRVEGNESISDETVIRAAKLPLGQKLSSVKEDQVRLALEGSGRIELIGIERKYPSEVILTVRERSRDAMIVHAGIVLMLEKDGTVVELVSDVPDVDAVYVTGLNITFYRLGQTIGPTDGRLEAMTAVIAALDQNNAREYVSELNVEDSNAIYLYSRTGMRVELGDAQNMDQKIIWMAGALKDLESRGEINGQLDVSSGNKADYSPA